MQKTLFEAGALYGDLPRREGPAGSTGGARRPDGQVRIEKIGGVDALGVAQREQRPVTRKQPYRLVGSAGEKLLEVLGHRAVCSADGLDGLRGAGPGRGLKTLEQALDLFGDEGDTLEIDDLQRPVSLMQVGLGEL